MKSIWHPLWAMSLLNHVDGVLRGAVKNRFGFVDIPLPSSLALPVAGSVGVVAH
jgi:hypothetical protein